MEYVLSQRLPSELVDVIAKEVHKRNFKDCLNQIKYCVVKIYAPKDGGYCFITSNNPNYYVSLLEEDLKFELFDTGLKNEIPKVERYHH